VRLGCSNATKEAVALTSSEASWRVYACHARGALTVRSGVACAILSLSLPAHLLEKTKISATDWTNLVTLRTGRSRHCHLEMDAPSKVRTEGLVLIMLLWIRGVNGCD
jgi:hypothetical protein